MQAISALPEKNYLKHDIALVLQVRSNKRVECKIMFYPENESRSFNGKIYRLYGSVNGITEDALLLAINDFIAIDYETSANFLAEYDVINWLETF